MKIIEKNPIIMIIIGVIGISLSSIFVRYSAAPSVVTAAFRLLWTVLFLTPVAVGKKEVRKEFSKLPKKTFWLSAVSGVFLAIHFALWFESLKKTSVASSTSIVCTEVVWVAIGYCLFLKGKLNLKLLENISKSIYGEKNGDITVVVDVNPNNMM
jgi:drug/metabolite transporter (DMT)-like permease